MDMQSAIRELQREMRGIPSRFAGGGAAPVSDPVRVGRVIGGNTLTGSLPGIKFVATAPSVATVIDPYTDPALADGVGYAYLYINGQQQLVDLGAGLVPQRVLLYHYNSFVRYALLGGGIGEFVLLGTLVTIPGAGANQAYPIAGL